MKLVDILARELIKWPQGARWILCDGANGCYADMGAECIALGIDCSEFDGNPTTAVFEAGWQTAVDALKAENCAHLWVGWSDTEACELCNKTRKIVVEWNGEGLPPAGIDVEVLHSGHEQWAVRHINYIGGPKGIVVFRGDVDAEFACPVISCQFRSIRTPEQIAAEERERSIEQMILVDEKGSLSRTHFCGLLYDAGYRKFEIVDN